MFEQHQDGEVSSKLFRLEKGDEEDKLLYLMQQQER